MNKDHSKHIDIKYAILYEILLPNRAEMPKQSRPAILAAEWYNTTSSECNLNQRPMES
jgi:hypothetical protein